MTARWSPSQYSKFEDARSLPARDLLAMVPLEAPRGIVDIGCGPGNSTAILVERFPDAEVTGLDTSPEMLAAARKRLPAIVFAEADIAGWSPPRPVDLLFANAVFQWVPDHLAVIERLLAALPDGGVFAMQVPDNLGEPSHLLMRRVAAAGPWRGKFETPVEREAIPAPGVYYDRLRRYAAHIDIRHISYYHPLADAAAIVDWVLGTGLRPYLDRLDELREGRVSRRIHACRGSRLSAASRRQGPPSVSPALRRRQTGRVRRALEPPACVSAAGARDRWRCYHGARRRRSVMEFDAVLLSRLQFAFTIAFHIIFPSFTIGLSAWIATLLVIWRRTGEARYRDLARFWTRIFAVSFAMGVVSGIVLSYQFGTNWSEFSIVVGNVVGPLIGYEVLTAFFLEATFLGILLFGWNRVPPGLHVLSAVLVAVGTLFSAFWILSANSWMQFPTGHEIRNGIAYPADWLAVIFSPTFPIRFAHMVIAAYLTTAFVVLATGARYLIAGIHRDHGLTMLKMGLGMAVVLAPIQFFVGDSHGLSAEKYQPAKIAAVEAHWNGDEAAPLVLFAIPDEKTESNRFEISIPNGASLIITHSLDGHFPGLKDFPVTDRPPVMPPFLAFRIMVGIGVLMILVALWGAYRWARGRLEDSNVFLRIASLSWPAGFVAILSGWTVAETGRQPWIATGVLRTADAASPVEPGAVATTLVLFLIVYAIVFAAGIVYMNRLIRKGPSPEAPPPTGVPNRPLTAARPAPTSILGR